MTIANGSCECLCPTSRRAVAVFQGKSRRGVFREILWNVIIMCYNRYFPRSTSRRQTQIRESLLLPPISRALLSVTCLLHGTRWQIMFASIISTPAPAPLSWPPRQLPFLVWTPHSWSQLFCCYTAWQTHSECPELPRGDILCSYFRRSPHSFIMRCG